MWRVSEAFPKPSIFARRSKLQSTSSLSPSHAIGGWPSLRTVRTTSCAASSIPRGFWPACARCLRGQTERLRLISRRCCRPHHLLPDDRVVRGRLKKLRVRLVERHVIDNEVL